MRYDQMSENRRVESRESKEYNKYKNIQRRRKKRRMLHIKIGAIFVLMVAVVVGALYSVFSGMGKNVNDPSVIASATLAAATAAPTPVPTAEPTPVNTGKVVYITFDDGPCKTTARLLDVLDECDVKATFFVTSQFLDDNSLVNEIREIKNRGHQVGVHSYSHQYDEIYSSADAFISDYNKMDDIIYQATGKRSEVYRFPGGSNTGYNKAIRSELISYLSGIGVEYFDWNAYDGDCDGYEGQALIDRAVKESSYKDKSILLMHNIPGKDTVIDAIPSIVSQLREKGYSFDILRGDTEPIHFNIG